MDEDMELAVEIHEYGEDLTEWELEFLDSVMDQLADERELTSKQKDKLETIYNERVN